jgi:hypothetical protein
LDLSVGDNIKDEFKVFNLHPNIQTGSLKTQSIKLHHFSTTINHIQLDHLDLMRLFNPIDEAYKALVLCFPLGY